MDAVAGEVCCRFRPADAGANTISRVIERRAASRLRELHLRQRSRLPPITRPTVIRRLRRRSSVAGVSKLASVAAVKEAARAPSTTDATGRRRRRATESADERGTVPPIVERFPSDQSSLSSIHCLLSPMPRFISRPVTLDYSSHSTSTSSSSSSASKSSFLLAAVGSTAKRRHRRSKRLCRRSPVDEERFKRLRGSSSILDGLPSTWGQVDYTCHTGDSSPVKFQATGIPKGILPNPVRPKATGCSHSRRPTGCSIAVEAGVWCRSYYLRSSSGEFDRLVRSRSTSDLCSQWWLS